MRGITTSRLFVAAWVALMAGIAASVLADEPVLPTAEEAWQRLTEGNERFAAERLQNKSLGAARRAVLAQGQHPFAIVLTCSDSRLAPELLFDQGLGDLFVVRVAGNVSEPFALGSIEYAVEHLHVPLVVVLGHEKCGAVAAALCGGHADGNLGKLIKEIKVGEHRASDKDHELARAVENNVRYQTRLLSQRSDVLREHVERQKLRIVEGVYQFETGKVEWLGDDSVPRPHRTVKVK